MLPCLHSNQHQIQHQQSTSKAKILKYESEEILAAKNQSDIWAKG